MDVLLLRTLTFKSRMKFGQYKDLTVHDVLYGMFKPNALIQCYYNLSMVNFTDEVLTAIGVTKEWRIKKPGRDHQKKVEFFKWRAAQKTDIERIRDHAHKHKVQKITTDQHDKGRIKSKGLLQAINHRQFKQNK